MTDTADREEAVVRVRAYVESWEGFEPSVTISDERDPNSLYLGDLRLLLSGGEGWRPIESAPRDGTEFIATVRVFSNSAFSHHDMHIVAVDDETGELANHYEQGWRLEDYEFWRPLPAPPSQSCGGVIGEECWNPQECAEISADIAARPGVQVFPDARPEFNPINAINWALEHEPDLRGCSDFLHFWREGNLAEYPDYVAWAAALSPRSADGLGSLAAKDGAAAPPQAPVAGSEDSASEVVWRCFHCDEAFADPAAAAEHFGSFEDCTPICKVGAARFRQMEDELASWRSESDTASKEFYALGAKHSTALREAEQQGYDKGLADGLALPRQKVSAAPPHHGKDALSVRPNPNPSSKPREES